MRGAHDDSVSWLTRRSCSLATAATLLLPSRLLSSPLLRLRIGAACQRATTAAMSLADGRSRSPLTSRTQLSSAARR